MVVGARPQANMAPTATATMRRPTLRTVERGIEPDHPSRARRGHLSFLRRLDVLGCEVDVVQVAGRMPHRAEHQSRLTAVIGAVIEELSHQQAQ